jgi:hypothetical protein
MIGQLQEIERRLDPFRHEDSQSRRWRSPEARQRCARQIEECDLLLQRLLAQEKEGERELTLRRDRTSQQLQGVVAARQARQAYMNPGRGAANRLDLVAGD